MKSLFIFPRTKGAQGDSGKGEAVSSKPTLEFESLAELGAYLKTEREKAGLSRSEITNRTKITLDQLSNIEAGTFTGLAPVYAKGFLKSYAQNINLDPSEIVREYKRHTGELAANPYKPLTSKYRESDIVSEDGVGIGSILAVLLVIVVALVLLVTFNSSFRDFAAQYISFLKPQEAQPTESNAGSVRAPVVSQSARVGAETAPLFTTPLQSPESAPMDSATPAAASAASAPTQASTQSERLPIGEGGNLVLTAVATTWAQLTVDSGPLIHVYFKEGESRRFNCGRSIIITTGNGRALQAEWNGVVYQQLGPEGPMERTFPPTGT
ncbi:MAG: helix-turn-helix domain-containing protein [Deltaproteobacteria bacterium]|nr:helix-turn-helix domain-containing protein [Deltaproteobacteria bacterium]